MKRIRTLFPAMLLLGAPMAGAGTVPLHPAPDAASPVVTTVSANDPALDESAPVLYPEDGADSWHWTQYRARLEGFVPDRKVTKNFVVAPGTALRARPSADDEAITRVRAGDEPEVLSSDGGWVKIRLDQTLPLYFRKNEEGNTAVAAATPEPESEGKARTRSPEPATAAEFDPEAEVGTLPPQALPPENVLWESSPADPVMTPSNETGESPQATAEPPEAPESTPPPSGELGNIVVSPESVREIQPPRPPEPKAGTPVRVLAGQLIRSRRATGPRYPLRLRNDAGRRVAYVDMSHLFIHDIRPYLDRKVLVRGEVRPLVPGSSELVIQARTIRIAE